jgi:hypothetical protein
VTAVDPRIGEDTGKELTGLRSVIGSKLAERKVRTPDRALAEIEKLETADVAELGDPVYVWPAPRGRVTGHAVGCAEHGVMPFLAPSKRAAHLAAARHIINAHGSAGTIVLTEKPPRLRVGS